MATLAIAGGTADGRLRKQITQATGWANIQADTPAVDTDDQDYGIHRSLISTTFYLDRMYICFDVSPFQAGGAYEAATITGVSLHMQQYGGTGVGRTCSIYYWDWGTSLATGDWSGSFGEVAAAAVYYTGAGPHDIALTNISNLLTVNGRFEIANDAEGTEPTGTNEWDWYTANSATESYRPVLTVTYTMPGKPCFYNTFRQMRA